MTWIRKQKDPKPYIVGAGWVMKCKEEGRKVAEEPHCVPIEDECMFQKVGTESHERMLISLRGASQWSQNN